MQEKIEIISNNRKAFYSYTIIDKYESGMILLGSEVKSLREKKLNLKAFNCLSEAAKCFVRI